MRFVKLLMCFTAIVVFISCSAQNGKIVVAEYGKDRVYLDEFEKAYAKNSGGIERAKKDSIAAYKKFLDLYVNYRMKLRDGEVRGFAADLDMNREYDDYKANIGTALMLEKIINDPSMKQLYDRRKIEYRASHIFIPVDTLRNKEQAESFANELIARINKGEDFVKLAAEYSKDVNTAQRGGDVYFFTAGMINLPAIEDAIYSLKVGEVFQKPLFSGQGFHILKATEMRPRRISIRADHILISSRDTSGAVDTVNALSKIKDIEKRIQEGESFNELAFQLSEDPGSKEKKGDLGFFDRGRMVPEFDQAAFNLKVGEISPIVKTQFGYHLIKLTDETQHKPYEEDKDELRDLVHRGRYKIEYDKFVENLKKEFDYTLNYEVAKKIVANADTTKITQGYPDSKIAKYVGNEVLFTLAGKSFSVDSLFNHLLKNANYIGRDIDQRTIDDGIALYAGDLSVKEKAMNYDKQDAEFANLMAEYKNGMYLFKILEEEVWQKINIDSAMTKNFWEANKEKFKWGNRVEFKEIYVNQDSLQAKVASGLASGESFDTLYVKYNMRTGFENKLGYSGLVEITVNELARQANEIIKVGSVSEPFKFEDGWSFVKLVKKDPARLKTYEEAKPEAASMLQELESKRLDEEYMKKLQKLYKPKLYYENLEHAFKK
ncbi:MAG: Parvulin-like peptidyl-prolyl isomerase [Ignavibacteria bacterium]|nr:MAG: Parvulin-like peptidyl-prolyl isomerase [Ignavibacteria bacterium]KAF0161168.1 MAG: Parvulin-like peptidyl-prolyl isomerase [Ignavibacteria bacterium]